MPNSSCFTWVSWQWSVFPAVCWHFPGQVRPQAFPHSLNSNQPPLANIRDIFSFPFRISCNKKMFCANCNRFVSYCIFKNRTIQVWDNWSWKCPGTSAQIDTPGGILWSLLFRKQWRRRVEGPWRGAVSAWKALQGSETRTMELLGVTEE